MKTFDPNVCILCNGDVKGSVVVHPKDGSRQLVINAAQRRKDEAANCIFSLSETEKSLFKWHRECYMRYTSSTNISRIQKKVDENPHCIPGCSSPSSRRIVSRNFDKKKCIFCQNASYKGQRQMFRISEKTMAEKLLKYVKVKRDDVFTRLCTCTSAEDIFAADVMYHSGCEKKYFRNPVLEIETPTPSTDSTSEASTTLEEAFHMLIAEVDEELQCKCFELTALTMRLKELSSNSVEVDNRTTKRLLVAHYGGELLFSLPKDKSKSSLVFKITIPLHEVVEEIRRIRENRAEVIAG